MSEKNARVIIALFAGLLGCAVLLAGNSWKKKTPDQWQEDEIHQILTNSPWARPAKVTFAEPSDFSVASDSVWLKPLVRWQSSEAVRSAYAKAGVTEPGAQYIHDYYVIAGVGLPAARDVVAKEDNEKRRQYLEGTRLFVGKNLSFVPDRIETQEQDGEVILLFLFARTDFRPSAKDTLQFTCQLGPLRIVADFRTQEMHFGGGLDL